MVSLVCSNVLNTVVKELSIKDTGQILDATVKLLLETFKKSDNDVKDGMDISLVKLTFNKENTITDIEWSGANNPLWITDSNKSQVKKIKPNKQPIGKYDNMKPFTTHKILFSKGMTLYLFTDGYADQFGGERRKKFMYRQLEDLFLTICDKPMENQKQILGDVFA